jgi:hypothetical protein
MRRRLWHDGSVAQRVSTLGRGAALRRVLALAVLAAAAILALVQLPSSLQDLSNAAAYNATKTGPTGALRAVADPYSIDNGFVDAVVERVHAGDRFAVLVPAHPPSGIYLETLQTLGPFLRYVLLPAREVTVPARGDYILCYVCDSKRWSGRTHWLWSNSKGMAIGRVVR